MKKCDEPTCTATVTDDRGRCYYHGKLDVGLLSMGLNDNERRMAEYDTSVRDYVRRYPTQDPFPKVRHHVLESAVVDDEQRELSAALNLLGADAVTIRSAFSRKSRRPQLNRIKGGRR